ncbi:MAG: helix-turn-helix transcriptional regulator [Candidatus Odinarchaeota archaeon]
MFQASISQIQQMHPDPATVDPAGYIITGIIIGFISGIAVLAVLELLVYLVLLTKRQPVVAGKESMTDGTVVPSEVAKSAVKYNLDPVKTSVLQAIHNGDVLLQSDIPTLFKLNKTRVSEILNEFEQLDLIRREKAGRTYRLFFTAVETCENL